MKSPLILPLLLTTLLLACKPSTPSGAEVDTTDTTEHEMTAQIPKMTCYMTTLGPDTFRLKVERFPNVVTGQLAYLFSQKDKSTGDLEGTMSGDTLFAMYTYQSEGTTSQREVVFLLQNNTAQEGSGLLQDDNGVLRIANRNSITFDKGLRLQTTDCHQQ